MKGTIHAHSCLKNDANITSGVLGHFSYLIFRQGFKYEKYCYQSSGIGLLTIRKSTKNKLKTSH
jgi:hypothetical protein